VRFTGAAISERSQPQGRHCHKLRKFRLVPARLSASGHGASASARCIVNHHAFVLFVSIAALHTRKWMINRIDETERAGGACGVPVRPAEAVRSE
jgi:hypothetical protein